MNGKMYIRIIDGSDAFMPVNYRRIGHNLFRIRPDPEFDYSDNSILFEFGPNDVIKTKRIKAHNSELISVANELIEEGNIKNRYKRFQFYIMKNHTKLRKLFNENDIRVFVNKLKSEYYVYPDISKWLKSQKDKREG